MRALTIVPRGYSTEFALYEDGVQLLNDTFSLSLGDACVHHDCDGQGNFRSDVILDGLERAGIQFETIDVAVSTTIALLPPQPGAYLVTKEMLENLMTMKSISDPDKVGAFIVWSVSERIARKCDAECLPVVVEPTAQSEMMPEAMLSGVMEIERRPMYHALSQRGAARSYAANCGKNPEDLNLIVAHLGSEISVGAHERGWITDCNSPLDGEGPFSPRTSGTLPVDALLRLCYSGKYDMDELLRMVEREGGLVAHLGMGRLDDVVESYGAGDEKVRFLTDAMAYKTAREIGARAAALCGRVDAIILTGPWASFEEFTDVIRSHVEWIAPVSLYSWESEMRSLAEVARGIYTGTEELRLCVAKS